MGGQGGVTRNLTILGFKQQNKQYIYNLVLSLLIISMGYENLGV